MNFQVNLDLENPAFEDAPCAEVAAILRKLATTLEAYDDPMKTSKRLCPLFDSNGNHVGAAHVLPSLDEDRLALTLMGRCT